MAALGDTVQDNLRMNNTPSRDDMHIAAVATRYPASAVHRLALGPELGPLML